MASQSGNAWAQMKARGQQQQIVDEGKVAIPLKSPVMAHRPTSSRKSSGLDYDDELALPMPKPRRVAAEEHNISIQDVRPNLHRVLSITKTRSVTEPVRSDNIPDELKDKTGNSEKKKSRVAALKSKLSLKDMIQEFRKENAKTESAAGSSSRNPPCACSHGFGEAKLYVPKARQPGVYPSSAPPFPVRDVSFGEMSQASTESCGVGNSKTNHEGPNNKGLSLGPVASKNNDVQSLKARKAETNIQLDTILLAGSSSEGHAGELKNSRQPHIMKEQPSNQSLTTHRELEFPATASKDFVHVSEDYVGGLASFPSGCDNEDIVVTATQPSVSNQDLHSANNGGTGSNITSATSQISPPTFPPQQTGPPFAAMSTVLDPNTHQYQPNPCNESQHRTFADGTTYGGYAPRPPPTDYFNTASNLEMQLKMNMEMIHVHLNNTVHRVCSSLENSNNWSTDQILKQTDAMADILRLINARTAGHNGTVSDLHRTITHIQCQIAAIEVQANDMEERIMKFMSSQINKLRRDINAPRESFRRAGASQLTQDPRTIGTGLQEPPNAANLTEDNERRLCKKKQHYGKRGEAGWLRSTENRMGEQKKGSETESGGKSLTQGNAQRPFRNIQHSPASVHSSSWEQRKYGGRAQSKVRNGMQNNPSQESSGSPMPKTSKPSHQTGKSLVPEDDQSSISEATQALSIDDKPINECMKTPSKKGMFRFRRRHNGENQTGNIFMRTPRRNKENRSLKEPSSLHSMASVPSVVAGATQMKAMVMSSPSSIHPALRDDRQEQAILDQQRTGGLLHSHTSGYLAISARENAQMNGLKYSQSHQSMGNITPMTSHPPGSFVIASYAASQGKLSYNGWSAPNLLSPSRQVCVPISVRESAANTPDLDNCCNDIPLESDRYDSGAW